MLGSWEFDPDGPDFSDLIGNGSIALASVGMGLPASPGIYVVTCGACLAHIGTSKKLAHRVRGLARLGAHRGSSEVLCAAYCANQAPMVWWARCGTVEEARQREAAFKRRYGEPPVPRASYEGCVNGKRIRDDLIKAAGEGTWAAGYIEAVFDIGESLSLLFDSRFDRLWKSVGRPPGPWAP